MGCTDLGEVTFASIDDLIYVVDLSKKENHSLGFIPKMAYESAITGIKKGKRWSDVCNDRLFTIKCNNDLVGFCLSSFGQPGAIHRYGKIVQICIQQDARKIERGRLLLSSVLAYGARIGAVNFECGCADDLESNIFWQCMGWKHIATRKGISHTNTWNPTSKRSVNIYRYFNPEQMLLFEKR